MEAAVGHSAQEDSRLAAEEALACLAGFGRADFAVLFATSHHAENLQAIVEAIRGRLGSPQLFGGSTSNVITAGGEHEQLPGLGILALRGVRGRAAMDSDPAEIARDLAEPAALHLVLPDPKRMERSQLLSLRSADGPLAGGGVLGDSELGFTLANDAVGGGPCALARLDGLRVQVEIAQGAEPMTEFKPVKARRNAVLELGGEPGISALTGHLADNGFDRDKLQTMLIAAIRKPGAVGHVARPILGVELDSGAFTIASGDLTEGTEVAFAWRETLAATRALKAALARIAADPAPVRALLYFNCASRGSSLHLEPDADIGQIRAAFPGVPMLGMSTAFELATQGTSVDLLMYCGVLVALRDG